MTDRMTPLVPLNDEDLIRIGGGYVIINPAGCYELFDDKDQYQGTFRGDQLDLLRTRAKALGISDQVISSKPKRLSEI